MRLIDADALKKGLEDWYCAPERCNSYNGVRCRACALDDALNAIEDAPTIAELDKTEKAIIKMFRKKMFLAVDDTTIYDPVAWSLYQVWKWFDEHRKGRRNDGH